MEGGWGEGGGGVGGFAITLEVPWCYQEGGGGPTFFINHWRIGGII